MNIPKKHFYAVNLALGLAGLMMVYNNMSFVPDCYSRFAEAQNKVVSDFHSCQQGAGSAAQQMACYESYQSQKPVADCE